tara:strand:- start:1277 stop:1564 length:288 start_codon:yes stop_codon:yes gene_type:complete
VRIIDNIWAGLSDERYYNSIKIRFDIVSTLMGEYKEELNNSGDEYFGEEMEVVSVENLRLKDLSYFLGLKIEVVEDIEGESKKTFQLFESTEEGN